MANTSSRTLRLLSLLQSQRYWPGPDLASQLGVSVRTLRRDVDRLRELGYPVEAQPGVDGGYQLAAGASLPPLALDDDEAVALAVGLQAATSSAVAGMAEPSLRALAKVVQVMPPRLRRRVEALRAMTASGEWGTAAAGPDPGALMTVAQACRDSAGLALSYVAADRAATRRSVEPHRLVSLGRRWYLVAYDLDRQDWRNFRVDRIASVSLNSRRFRPRELPMSDPVEYVRQSISSAAWGFDVSAVVALPAVAAREKLGSWAQVEPLGEVSCRLVMSADNLDWAAFALGVVGAEISQVEPPELVDLLHSWADRFTRLGSSPPR